MNTRTAALLVATSIASITLAVAQTSPQPDTTSPSAASSPHQRDTTQTQAPEAPSGNGANPAAASTPHQQQTTSAGSQMSKAGHRQAMKDCITKEQADHTGMSMADAKKACKEQFKANAQK
jgi:hypothetical protein